MWIGAGRALVFLTNGETVMRVTESKKVVTNIKRYGRYCRRVLKNLKTFEHVRKLQGIQKAGKKFLTAKLY